MNLTPVTNSFRIISVTLTTDAQTLGLGTGIIQVGIPTIKTRTPIYGRLNGRGLVVFDRDGIVRSPLAVMIECSPDHRSQINIVEPRTGDIIARQNSSNTTEFYRILSVNHHPEGEMLRVEGFTSQLVNSCASMVAEKVGDCSMPFTQEEIDNWGQKIKEGKL